MLQENEGKEHTDPILYSPPDLCATSSKQLARLDYYNFPEIQLFPSSSIIQEYSITTFGLMSFTSEDILNAAHLEDQELLLMRWCRLEWIIISKFVQILQFCVNSKDLTLVSFLAFSGSGIFCFADSAASFPAWPAFGIWSSAAYKKPPVWWRDLFVKKFSLYSKAKCSFGKQNSRFFSGARNCFRLGIGFINFRICILVLHCQNTQNLTEAYSLSALEWIPSICQRIQNCSTMPGGSWIKLSCPEAHEQNYNKSKYGRVKSTSNLGWYLEMLYMIHTLLKTSSLRARHSFQTISNILVVASLVCFSYL